MYTHILGIDVVPTIDPNILHLFDTSDYAEFLGKTCAKLEISVPGYKDIRVFEPSPYFNLALNGKHLRLISEDSDYLCELPDGIYFIRYSLAPNDKTFIEIEHLRTVQFENMLNEYRCSLKLQCGIPDSGILSQLKELNMVENYLKAAKASVDYCGEYEKGMELFSYAKRLFSKLNC